MFFLERVVNFRQEIDIIVTLIESGHNNGFIMQRNMTQTNIQLSLIDFSLKFNL